MVKGTWLKSRVLESLGACFPQSLQYQEYCSLPAGIASAKKKPMLDKGASVAAATKMGVPIYFQACSPTSICDVGNIPLSKNVGLFGLCLGFSWRQLLATCRADNNN